MTSKRKKYIVASILGLSAYALAAIWFGWKLLVILFLLDWCNGINTSIKLSEKLDAKVKMSKEQLMKIFEYKPRNRDLE